MDYAIVTAGAAAATGAAVISYRTGLLGRLRSRLRALAALRLRSDLVEYLDEALRGSVSPQEVSKVMRSLRGCPSRAEEVALRLARLGLYEDVVRLASMGCGVGALALRHSRAGLMALGAAKWESEASRLLGEQPRLSGQAKVAVALCLGSYAEVMIDGVSSRLPPEGSEWRAPPAEELMATVVSQASPSLLLTWGRCGVRGIDVSLLASLAFPESPGSLVALAYGLDVSPSAPLTSIALRVALEAARTLEAAGVRWDSLPQDVREARRLLEIGEAESWAAPLVRPLGDHGETVVITDRPKLYKSLWRPVALGERGPSDPLVDAAIRSLRLRGGDVVRAWANAISGRHPLGKALADAIAEAVEVNDKPPSGGQQVEPWDLGLLSSDLPSHRLDCLRPGCAGDPDEDVIRVEGELLSRLGISLRRPQRELPALRRDGGQRVRVYGSRLGPGPGGLAEAVSAAVAMVRGARRALLVTPSEGLKGVVLRSVGGSDPAAGPDLWAARGGLGVVSWSEALRMPYLLGTADSVVIMFPERLLPRGRAHSLEEAARLALTALRSAGASAVSRLLASCGCPDVELVDPGAEPVSIALSPEDIISEAQRAFSRLWGGLRLRPYQLAAIRAFAEMIASGRPTAEVVILPTGAGKSAIFQSLAVALADMGLGSSAIVISPLRALMHDQVNNALARGLRAAYIDSGVGGRERREILRLAAGGVLDLVYITPEGFGPGPGRELMESGPSLLVLDEAHSVSRWGLSFRPSYLYMASEAAQARVNGWPPVMALTASAPADVVDDILEMLGYGRGDYDLFNLHLQPGDEAVPRYSGRPVVLRAPSIRPEISVDVVVAPSGPERAKEAVRLVRELSSWSEGDGNRWLGIVFVPFVESSTMPWLNAEEVARELGSAGIGAVYYHGQLGDRERRRLEKAIVESARTGRGPNVVVATKAFGMGVDIPNIRWTLHLMPSGSVEDLYQEIGRAGRDGRPAKAIILYSPDDLKVLSSMASSSTLTPLAVLRFHNTVARAFEAVKGHLVALPLPGQSWALVKYADVLRASGIIDYEVIRGRLAVYSQGRRTVEEAVGWCIELRDGRCVSAESGELRAEGPAYLSTCGDAISYTVGPAEGCESAPLDGLIMLISAPRRLRPARYLEPEVFATALWISRRERDRVEELRRLLDEVVASRARGGPAAADAKFKELVDEALRRGRRAPTEAPRLGRVVECDRLADCVDEVVNLAVKLEDLVGDSGVTIVGPEKAVAEVSAAHLRRAGRAISYSQAAYRRALRLIRAGALDQLMNMGYLIVVARGTERLRAIMANLRGYPYAQAYLYRQV